MSNSDRERFDRERNVKWWHRQGQNPVNFGYNNEQPTQYVDEYRRHEFKPVTSFRPNQSYRQPMNPMDNKTTFSVDYQPHQLQKHELPTKLPYIPPSQMMATQSMYSHEYTGKNGAPAMPIRPKQQRSTGVKFDAVPTYAHDYIAYAPYMPERFGPTRSWAPPQQKMDGLSTSRRDYDGKTAPRQMPIAPNRRPVQSDQPMDNDTTNRLDFVAHPLERRMSKTPRAYQPPLVPMDGTTTNRQSYNEKERSVREMLRPPRSMLKSLDPMAGSSEQRDRYIAWPTTRPDRHQPLPYQRPQGQFDLKTTTGTDFIDTHGRPAQAIRPINRRQQQGEFDGSTNYTEDFKVWPVVREISKDTRTYTRPEVPFEGKTTFNQEYVEYAGAIRQQPCKPGQSTVGSQQPMEGETMYSTAYVPKSLENSVRYPTPEWMKQREGKIAA